ncbi:1296_t:CDS:2, partial [Scutellospora calospora]
MPPKSRKQKLELQQNEVDSALNTLRSGPFASIIKLQNATLTEKNETMKLILEITKQVLTQNISIVGKQDALESVVI